MRRESQNERIFTMEVRVFGERQGKGKSKKKKDAEQKAAQEAIKRLRITEDFSKIKRILLAYVLGIFLLLQYLLPLIKNNKFVLS